MSKVKKKACFAVRDWVLCVKIAIFGEEKYLKYFSHFKYSKHLFMRYVTRRKWNYLFNARHRKGHGIHSPFLFRLITEVIENKGHFSVYPLLKGAQVNVRDMIRILDVESYRQLNLTAKGFRPRWDWKQHLLPERFDRLLFRLVKEFQPRNSSFYGSTFGTTLLAVALADRRRMLAAQVENEHFRSFCRRLVEEYEVQNIDLTGEGTVVASDFAVVMNPTDPDNCDAILAQIFAGKDFQGVAILCGLHTSAEMEAVWNRHQSNPVVKVTLDLFEIGIFICREGLQKEAFVLRF
jgi:hypothetical protein